MSRARRQRDPARRRARAARASTELFGEALLEGRGIEPVHTAQRAVEASAADQRVEEVRERALAALAREVLDQRVRLEIRDLRRVLREVREGGRVEGREPEQLTALREPRERGALVHAETPLTRRARLEPLGGSLVHPPRQPQRRRGRIERRMDELVAQHAREPL